MSISLIVNAISAERESNHNLGMQLIEASRQKIAWHAEQIKSHQAQMEHETNSLNALQAEIEARDRALGIILTGPESDEQAA